MGEAAAISLRSQLDRHGACASRPHPFALEPTANSAMRSVYRRRPAPSIASPCTVHRPPSTVESARPRDHSPDASAPAPPSSGPAYDAVHVPMHGPSPAMFIDHWPFTNLAIEPVVSEVRG